MVDYCVCAEPIVERGVYPCKHALCLNCTLKKRVLMRDDSCPYCRAPGPHVAVVQNGESAPENATIDFRRWGIWTETAELAAELSHILSFPCPHCDEEQKNYKKLKAHLQKEHGKLLCDVCTKHEFVFSDEYQTFDSAKAHHKHLEKEHIKCKYCNVYFYSTTEFSKHCRQTHFGCEVCERRDPQHPRYFKTYDELSQHYTDKHYACMVPSCLEDKHIVFSTQMELQSHMLEAHPGLIGNRRDFQQVDIAQLSLSEADNIQEPAVEVEQQNFVARYFARLDIVANHDSEKVDQIKSVNQTFLGKKVPVEIFTATYESVLKDASKPQVTALLLAFNKAYSAKLAGDTRRQLTFALQKRTQSEDEAYDDEKKAQRRASAAAGPMGPAPTRVQKFGWGGAGDPRVAGRGVNGFGSLPQLGQGKAANPGPAAAAKPGSYASAASKYKPSTRQVLGLNRLPQLPTPKAQQQQQQQPVRQTSVPLRSSSRTNSRFASSYLPVDYSRFADGPASRPASPSLASPTPEAADPPASKQAKPRLNNLPSLPSATPATGQAKKKKNSVLRIV